MSCLRLDAASQHQNTGNDDSGTNRHLEGDKLVKEQDRKGGRQERSGCPGDRIDQ